MVDHVRTLLVNPSGISGYGHVTDAPADAALRLFGVTGDEVAEAVVDTVLPLALAPDLVSFRRFYDTRTTPSARKSVYRETYAVELDGLYDRVFGSEGWWTVLPVFSHPDPAINANLSEMREAARSLDSAYALGAVLLACAYRRHILQGES